MRKLGRITAPTKGNVRMSDIVRPFRFEPQAQRSGGYSRQRQMTLSDLLMENRIIFLGSSPDIPVENGVIVDYMANAIIQRLLFLQYENRNQEIHLYINSPGGSVTATLAIYDTMQFLECPIATYCMGIAASGAAILLAAGTKGKRFALPHAKVMLHQPWGKSAGRRPTWRFRLTKCSRKRARSIKSCRATPA